jgi:predicted TIM-barrel fold metal-dependent hydrolase
MDVNGVAAELCFPNYIRFCGQILLRAKDKALARFCVEAYNDWMVDEWAGSGGRLIPLCIVPLWDVNLAVAEIRRNAARGVRAVAFSELLAYLDLPSLHSRYRDPFFAACEETGTVLAMHIGSGTRTPQMSADAPGAVGGTIIFGNSVASMTDFMFSGVLHRYCFFKDAVGVELLDKVGLDNVTFETDYPHQDGTWPRSREEAALQFGYLSQDLVTKIARGNAIKLLGLDLPES